MSGMTRKQMIGRRIRAARKKAKLTQVELGALLGHQAGDVVSRWELGKTSPATRCLIRLSNSLAVTIDYLVASETLDLREDDDE